MGCSLYYIPQNFSIQCILQGAIMQNGLNFQEVIPFHQNLGLDLIK